jgi:hypothetical protein
VAASQLARGTAMSETVLKNTGENCGYEGTRFFPVWTSILLEFELSCF